MTASATPRRGTRPRSRDPEGGARQITLKKTDVARAVAVERRFPMSIVAETFSVSRSNLHDRLTRNATPRRRYHKAQDAVVVPLITALVAARPDLRISSDHGDPEPAVADLGRGPRQSQARLPHHAGAEPAAGPPLHRTIGPRPQRQDRDAAIEPAMVFGWLRIHLLERRHRSRAFIIDAHDREIIAWCAVAMPASAARMCAT